MAPSDLLPSLTPLQHVIYETDLLNLTLRDSMRIATQRMGFFVGQARYLQERNRVAAYVNTYGPPSLDELTEEAPGRITHQIAGA